MSRPTWFALCLVLAAVAAGLFLATRKHGGAAPPPGRDDSSGQAAHAAAPGQGHRPARALSPDGFTFVTYGDTRSGGDDCAGNAVHIALVERMKGLDPAFVVHNGDMITGLSNTTNFVADGACTAPGSVGSLKKIIAPLQSRTPPAGLPTAFFPVIGNHDDNWGDKWYPDPQGHGFCEVFDPRPLVPNHTRQPYFSGRRAPRYSDDDFYRLA